MRWAAETSPGRRGGSCTRQVRTWGPTRLTLLLAVASIAGCGAPVGTTGDRGTAAGLQVRVVTSSTQGPCSAPPLTTDGPGSACDGSGTTTYDVGAALGVVTPTSVTREGDGAGQTVDVQLGTAGTTTLRDLTGAVLDQQLAVLLDGRVISAPRVTAPITTGRVTFAFGTASEADRVAAALGASPRS